MACAPHFISSSANARLKLIKKLHVRRHRERQGQVLLEGHRLVVDALEAQGRKAAVVVVMTLSNRLFTTFIDPAEDRIHSDKDDEWNRKILQFLGDGRLEDVGQLSRTIHNQIRVQKVVAFKPMWFLSAMNDHRNDLTGEVLAYEARVGAVLGAVVGDPGLPAAGAASAPPPRHLGPRSHRRAASWQLVGWDLATTTSPTRRQSSEQHDHRLHGACVAFRRQAFGSDVACAKAAEADQLSHRRAASICSRDKRVAQLSDRGLVDTDFLANQQIGRAHV